MSTPSGSGRYSFFVRIWREPREDHQLPPEWRGMVEHLQSGARCYFVTLDEMLDFILPYLEGLDSAGNRASRLRRWWRRWWHAGPPAQRAAPPASTGRCAPGDEPDKTGDEQ